MKRVVVLAAALAAGATARAPRAPELAYRVTEGNNLNAFFRDGPMAAHVLLRNGTEPRVLVAFPAGNSGTGLWFETLARPATWALEASPQRTEVRTAAGPPLAGVTFTASTDAPRLVVRRALLTSIRFLRDYESVGRFPPEVATEPRPLGRGSLAWRRAGVGGDARGYAMRVDVLAGRLEGNAVVAERGRPIRLRFAAATGEPPLTGIPLADLLNERAAPDAGARNALAFLSYRSKFLAGSWRFQTYFGRDTLMSLRLLMPVLRPAAVEAGLGSVLARLNPAGEVAHEEGIGEFAALEHRRDGSGGTAATLDYGMVDDDYMLAPVAAEYLLGAAGARAFLARPVAGEARGDRTAAGALLVRNLRFVAGSARPFAGRPGFGRLVALKPGRMTGEWRDSEEGLGRGRYAYNVNAVFVPAALEAGARMMAAGLLDPYLSAGDRRALADLEGLARAWRASAPALFRVEVAGADAAAAVRRYAGRLGVPAAPALAALGSGPMVFHALSLDASGRAVPVVNSDEGFALLFTDPSPADLRTYVEAVARPFPAGLMTGAGMLVANAALTGAAVQDRFAPSAYHGAVVWSWQQALMAAGLERQLRRADLDAGTRGVLARAQATLWRAIEATRATRSSELWSWAYRDGAYRAVPFGAGKADVDESNAAQLWSTVYLAVRPPAASGAAGTRSPSAGRARDRR